MVFVAGFAEKMCEASAQDSTRHEAVQLVGHKLRQRAPAGMVGPALLEGQEVLLQAQSSLAAGANIPGRLVTVVSVPLPPPRRMSVSDSPKLRVQPTVPAAQACPQYANRLTETFITRPSASMTESALDPP
jgi:hypothetical protein